MKRGANPEPATERDGAQGAATFLSPTPACAGGAHSSGKVAGATRAPREDQALRALASTATGMSPLLARSRRLLLFWLRVVAGVVVSGFASLLSSAPGGTLIAGARSYGKTYAENRMLLSTMTATSLTPLLELPSSGNDVGYPGLGWHDGLLWVSYNSSHEGKTCVYLARVKLPVSQ